jgi:mycofactocin precursor
MVEGQTQDGVVVTAPADGATGPGDGSERELRYEDLVEEDLVEDVSIDGMCGVY